MGRSYWSLSLITSTYHLYTFFIIHSYLIICDSIASVFVCTLVSCVNLHMRHNNSSRLSPFATHCARRSCHFILWLQMFEYGINWHLDMMYILYKDNDRGALDIVLGRLPHVRTVEQMQFALSEWNSDVAKYLLSWLRHIQTHCGFSRKTCSLSDTESRKILCLKFMKFCVELISWHAIKISKLVN